MSGAYQRGLSRTFVGDAADDLAELGREEVVKIRMEKFPQRYWGIAIFDDEQGSYEGKAVQQFFSSEGGEQGADLWYSMITNDPLVRYAATWDLWGSGGAMSDADAPPTGDPDLRNVYKSPRFVTNRYPEPSPPGSGLVIFSSQPGIRVTAERAEDGDSSDAEGSPSRPGSGLLLGLGALAVGAGVVLGGKGKKRGGKIRV